MRQKKIFWQSGKFFLYAVMLLFFYALQTTPGAFQIAGIRPLWTVCFAIAVAMCEEVIAGALVGMFAGLFCDLGTQALFGFNGLLLLCGCAAIGLLRVHLVKSNWKSALLYGAVLPLVRALLEFFFFYLIWEYPSVEQIFYHSVLPVYLYTFLLTPPIFLLVQKIQTTFDSRWEE